MLATSSSLLLLVVLMLMRTFVPVFAPRALALGTTVCLFGLGARRGQLHRGAWRRLSRDDHIYRNNLTLADVDFWHRLGQIVLNSLTLLEELISRLLHVIKVDEYILLTRILLDEPKPLAHLKPKDGAGLLC